MSLGRHKIGAPSLIGAQAVDSLGDPHLADGIHFRIATGPDLGLPNQPLNVYRMNLGRGKKIPGLRRDVRWRDARRRTIAAPFNLKSGNSSATARLLPPSITQCCWLEVLTTGPVNLRVDAIVQDAGIVATRTSAPFVLTATAITRVRVSGRGQITGIRWLSVEDVMKEAVRREHLPDAHVDHLAIWRRLALPVRDAAHYSGAVPNPEQAAFERVARGAPKRLGLHDDPDAAGPATATTINAGDQGSKEITRLRDVSDKLIEYVRRLVTSDNPESVMTEETFQDLDGGVSFDIPVLDAIMQNLVDPGVAKFLGFADVDGQPLSTKSEDVLAYVISGQWDPRRQLSTVACAVVGHPPDSPGIMNMHKPISGPWLPATPPEAIRHMTLPISRFITGAMIALARVQTPGRFVALNGFSEPSKRARGLIPNLEEPTAFGIAEFLDRFAPPGETLYRSAQHDWFGRWSKWAQRLATAGIRPLPPQPVLDASYEQPAFGLPIPTNPLSGEITFEVPIPPIENLAPASHLLSALELDVDGLVQEIPLPANLDAIIDQLPGPPVPINGEVTVTLTARWMNTEGERSVPSSPRTLILRDPRPPLVVTFPPGMRYTSRPDARGRARTSLRWSSQPGQAYFRVFYTDEHRLIDALEGLAATGNSQAQGVLDALETQSDPPERARLFESVEHLFGRDRFEQLTISPLPAPAAGTAMQFEHDVPGDLEILSFYRVLAVSNAMVEAIFEESSLLPVRVPNSLVAPRPGVTVEPRINEQQSTFEALVRVTVPPGNVRAAQCRIRRTMGMQLDTNSMPTVSVIPMGPPNSGKVQVGEFIDVGASELSASMRFLPWHRYTWQVEVRGPQEVGAGPGAKWSEPGGPVGHLFIPESPPLDPTLLAVEGAAGGNKITFGYGGPVNGGVVGRYVLRVFRETGSRAPELAGSILIDEVDDLASGIEFIDEGISDTEVSYRAVIIDPLGRSSQSSASGSISGGVNG